MHDAGYRRQSLRNDLLLSVLTLPLIVAATGRYGLRIPAALAVTAVVGLATEWLGAHLRKRRLGAPGFVYWLWIPLVLPPAVPLWLVGVSAFAGVLIGLVFFGGHGRQLASPVAIAWAFAALSFQAEFGFGWCLPLPEAWMGFARWGGGVLTIDHPIQLYLANPDVTLTEVLRGDFPQTPAMAAPLVVMACGLLLLALRAVDVRGCVMLLATAALLTWWSHSRDGLMPPPETLLVGNFLPVALFVYGDLRTAPRTAAGRWLSGVMTGLVAFLIGSFGASTGGVLFAVLLANTFSPLLDEAVVAVKYRKVNA